MAKTAKSGVGKGSERRAEDFAAIQNNWDDIPNFGYKPKWARELEKSSDEKIKRYPDHAKELFDALMALDDESFESVPPQWDDDSTINFSKINWNNKLTSKLKKLLKKYNMDSLDLRQKTMYIWEVIDKMHSFRPF